MLKLTIELVPQSCWYGNMRKVMSSQQWDVLRRQVYAAYRHRCGICGAARRLECHEVWEYDDEHHIQALKGFIALCSMCHHVKHSGYANILAQQGKLNFDEVIQHFLRVNACSLATFEAHEATAWAQWEQRNHHTWTTDLGHYASLVASKLPHQ